ncbi:MAG: hypothetical protein WCF84_01300 [Anaerolineae bacterium]
MKKLFVLLIAGLMLAMSLSALPASASTTVPPNDIPATARYIDNSTHTITANSALWYKFDYNVSGSDVTLTLVNGANSGLGFDIYTADQIANWWENTPIGRGTAQALDCNNGVPATDGSCQAIDLTWVTKFKQTGTLYVRIVNDNANDANFQLTAQGDGLTLSPQGATTGTTTGTTTASAQTTSNGSTPATSTTSTTTQVTGANTDPGHAMVMDNAAHSIPANGSAWYRFDYAGDRSQITVSLVNGNNSGLGFKVFTPAQIADWWEIAPIGQGTPQQLNCDSGLPQPEGQCQSNDLMWMGQFNANGTYYVQLNNTNSNPVDATLKIQGDGVTLGQ